MANSGNKVYNIFINSANRNTLDKAYDFSVYFDNDEIIVNNNEGVNINVVSFSLMNSMYNINQYSSNNTFTIKGGALNTLTTITIPYGNYNVYTLLNQLNILLTGLLTVSYNNNNNLFTQPPRGDQAGSAHTAKGAGPPHPSRGGGSGLRS